MKKIHCLWSIAILSALVVAPGCSGGREVEVTGEAKAAAGVMLSGPISIEFFEVPAEDADAAEEAVSIKKVELAQAGEFTETVEVEGDSIRVFALNDLNKDGACNDGEPWAESQATVKEDGTVDPLTLELSAAACPLPE